MPFTLAHPAAILPLRRYGDLSALVIGSMVPDTGYLLLLEIPRQLTHGLEALLTFCLPAGILMYLLYHRVLREPFLALAPDGVRLRLAEHSELPASWRGWMRVAVSLVLGAATHLAWDGLAQTKGWFEAVFPSTAGMWFSVQGRGVDWYFALRHGSTVFGLALLAVWAGWQYRRAAPRAERAREGLPALAHVVLLLVLGAALLTLAAVVATLEPDLYAGHGPTGRGARVSVGLLTAALISYSLCWHAWQRWRR